MSLILQPSKEAVHLRALVRSHRAHHLVQKTLSSAECTLEYVLPPSYLSTLPAPLAQAPERLSHHYSALYPCSQHREQLASSASQIKMHFFSEAPLSPVWADFLSWACGMWGWVSVGRGGCAVRCLEASLAYLYILDAGRPPPPGATSKNVSRCFQMSPEVGVGERLGRTGLSLWTTMGPL